MKRFVIAVLITLSIVMLSFLTISGEDLTRARKTDISVNGGLTMKFSGLGGNSGFISSDSDFAYLLGFKAELVFNKNVYAGGAGYFLGNGISYKCSEIHNYSSEHNGNPCYRDYHGELQNGDLSLGYGGLTAGYIFRVRNFFRIETGGLIGGGQFSAINDHGDYYYKNPFFVLEPEVNFVFVITRFFAASVSFSYRIITGMENDSAYSTSDMSGPSAGIDVRFGSL